MHSELLAPNTTLTSHSSVSTVDSADDSLLAVLKQNKKINKTSFSELSQNSQNNYAAYFLQNCAQPPSSATECGQQQKDGKKSYYWKIYELAVLYLVSLGFSPPSTAEIFEFKFEFLREAKLNLKLGNSDPLAFGVLRAALRTNR